MNNSTKNTSVYVIDYVLAEECQRDAPGQEESDKLSPWVYSVLLILYSSFVVMSLTGNFVVCTQILTKKRLRTVGNYFTASLAISDIFMVILCVPFTVLTNLIYHHWIFGPFLCPMVGYLQLSSVIQRSFVLIAAAADRHHAIWHPMHKHLSKKTVTLLIGIIWLISLIIPIPIAMFSQVVSLDPNNPGLCLEVWPWENGRFAYGLGMMAITYFIPLVVLFFTYAHIVAIVGSKPPGEVEVKRDERRMSMKRKTIKTMISVVAAYAICWLPIHVLTILGDLNPTIFDSKIVHVMWLFFHWLAMSNSACNPIIYFGTKTVFRQALVEKLIHDYGVFRRGTEQFEHIFRRRSTETFEFKDVVRSVNKTSVVTSSWFVRQKRASSNVSYL